MDIEERLRRMDEMQQRHTQSLWEFDAQMEKTRRELTETLVVVTGIQNRQPAVQRGQAGWLEALQKSAELHREQTAIFDRKMIEIEDKLNALIAVVDGMHRHPPAGPVN